MDLAEDVVTEVERRLGVRLNRSTVATGAWAESAGHRTDRGTWVRVDSRAMSVIQSQSWVGAEAASVIPGVPMPAWLQSATWTDPGRQRVWRAIEVELVTEPTVAGRGAMLTTDPDLPAQWWAELHAALTALARFRTLRIAGRQELITRRISQVFGNAAHHLDTTVIEWATSHGDLHWGNITGPRRLVLLDWADWGLAPRGNDAAGLWPPHWRCPRSPRKGWPSFTTTWSPGRAGSHGCGWSATSCGSPTARGESRERVVDGMELRPARGVEPVPPLPVRGAGRGA